MQTGGRAWRPSDWEKRATTDREKCVVYTVVMLSKVCEEFGAPFRGCIPDTVRRWYWKHGSTVERWAVIAAEGDDWLVTRDFLLAVGGDDDIGLRRAAAGRLIHHQFVFGEGLISDTDTAVLGHLLSDPDLEVRRSCLGVLAIASDGMRPDDLLPHLRAVSGSTDQLADDWMFANLEVVHRIGANDRVVVDHLSSLIRRRCEAVKVGDGAEQSIDQTWIGLGLLSLGAMAGCDVSLSTEVLALCDLAAACGAPREAVEIARLGTRMGLDGTWRARVIESEEYPGFIGSFPATFDAAVRFENNQPRLERLAIYALDSEEMGMLERGIALAATFPEARREHVFQHGLDHTDPFCRIHAAADIVHFLPDHKGARLVLDEALSGPIIDKGPLMVLYRAKKSGAEMGWALASMERLAGRCQQAAKDGDHTWVLQVTSWFLASFASGKGVSWKSVMAELSPLIEDDKLVPEVRAEVIQATARCGAWSVDLQSSALQFTQSRFAVLRYAAAVVIGQSVEREPGLVTQLEQLANDQCSSVAGAARTALQGLRSRGTLSEPTQ
jgi:hypothetical protein